MVDISVFLIVLWLFHHLHPSFGPEARIAINQSDIFLTANDIYETKSAAELEILVYCSI